MPRFESAHDIVDSLCLRTGDLLMRNKGLYLDCCNDTWNDLNEDVLKLAERVKMPLRKKFAINKRTNSIDLPCNFLRLSSVNVIDKNGVYWPVYRNDRVSDDIVDISAETNCACEFKCGNQLCNTIKGYEAVTSTVTAEMPDTTTQTFTLIQRKAIDKNGFLYEENQSVQRIYTAGVWTDTQVITENKKLCQCEVDTNGCVCDTEHNLNTICHHCGISQPDQIPVGGDANSFCNPAVDEWIYYCNTKMDWFGIQCGGFRNFKIGCNNIYNISELGDRLIFPHNFGFDHVMVRFYSDIDLDDLQIPYMAKETFMTGLQYFSLTNNKKEQQMASIFGQKYSRQKRGLFKVLNKYRIAELKMIFTPPIHVPHYKTNHEHLNWSWGLW